MTSTSQGWKFRGWALKKKLDEEKEAQKRGERVVTLEDSWRTLTQDEARPFLSDSTGREDIRAEIDWIQDRLVQLLNKETKKICYTSGINTHEGTGKATAEALLRSLPHNVTQLYGITIEYVVSCTCYHPVHKCDA